MSVPPVVPATLNLNTIPSDELAETLKNLQLQNQALLQENRTLKVTHVPQHKTKAAVLEEAPDSDGEGILNSKDIQRLQWVGRSLVIFSYVWWDRLAVFGHNRDQCKEELDLLHAQLSEWNALSKEQQSQIEDYKKKKMMTESRVNFLRVVEALYEEVPEIYHDLIKMQRLSLAQMKTGTSRIRSTSVFNMKKSADLIYEDIVPIEVFANSNDHSTDPRCLFLLGYNSTRKRYAQCPNLLFPEGKAFKNGPALFRSSALVKARFLLTSDKSFMETGESTSIPYAANCQFYIKTIEATLNLTSTMKTLEYFDRNLFLPKRNVRGLVVASTEEASDEEEEMILRGLREPEEDRETEVAFSDEESAADATLLSPQLTLRAPTATSGTSIASNYVDVNDANNDNNVHNNNNISDDNDDNDDDEIMVNGTPPNMPIESNAVVAKTAWLQVPVMRTETVTFALPGTDTIKPVENTPQGALNDESMVTHSGTQGSTVTHGGICGGTRGRGGKAGKRQGQKKATGNVQNAPRGQNLRSRSATSTLVVNSLEKLDETIEDDTEYTFVPPM
ncbi:hypothetical protein EDD18DRAFT_1107294 [Armillaria luteobubalina]|uniref:Uncharacterized protein n=1 Tax=Armillaria luteobubalina TaxID=153913 RepID=A0AA39UV69_9AGAR|nr:hypothetical protein EDD18DRAFT_1107294 [Armillaria luteobubalina]